MTIQWEKVHVFISSTFNDMHAERDYLIKSVFPELREWCEKRKLRLVDIDLRWGVTEQDATQNKNVVKVCLDRIDDCRPFFLCFLGQRRGWVPGEDDISANTFEEFPGLRQYAGVDSVTEMEIRHALIEPLHQGVRVEKKPEDRYYKKVDHAFFYLRENTYLPQLPDDPPQLREIYTNEGIENDEERSTADRQLTHWREVEITGNSGRPVRAYQAAWDPASRTPELLMPLQSPSEEEENIQRWQRSWQQAGVTVTGTDIEEDDEQAQLARSYNQRLIKGRLGEFHVNGTPLAQIIMEDLQGAIAARYPDHVDIEEETDLQKEIDQQENFLFFGAEGFIERGDDFKALDDYVNGDSDQLFVLTAPGGLGKSTLLAKWVERYRNDLTENTDETIHFRFIGQSDRSTNIHSLLQLILLELKEVHHKLTYEAIPDDLVELRRVFPRLLRSVGNSGKTVIVIDALNQLQSGLNDLRWLPYKLPDDVKMIVSFKVGEPEADEVLEQMKGRVVHSVVKPFEKLEHRKQLVETYLDQFLKQLDERHLQTLINLPAAANPLYLKVVLSELRVFGAFANLGEKIRADFGTTPVSAFDGVLRRLENDPAYTSLDPNKVVPILFALMAHARQGLSVDELSTILLADLKMEKTAHNHKNALDTVHHFLRQVRSFLAQREGRYDYFFESFMIAARERYSLEVGDPAPPMRMNWGWQRLLASYFGSIPTWIEGQDGEPATPNTRKVSELPYHQAWGKMSAELTSTLTDFQFLDAKVRTLGPQALISDYDEANAAGISQQDLTLIQRTLRQCAHILGSDPDQLAGQLTGRLIRQKAQAIQDILQQAKDWRGAPWLRPLTPTLAPPTGPLLRTLSGHTEHIRAVAVTPDGTRVISASGGPGEDNTIRIWDIENGEELLKLVGHREHVTSLAVTPDGQRVISGSWDKTIRVWDIESGEQLGIIKSGKESIYTIAVAYDGQQIISGSFKGTLILWDLESGEEVHRYKMDDNTIKAAALSPDGKRVVSAGDSITLGVWDRESGEQLQKLFSNKASNSVVIPPDGQKVIAGSRNDQIKIWDLESGNFIQTLEGHTGSVNALAVSSDGKRLVSGSSDKTVRIWDLERGEEIGTLKGHTRAVQGVAVTPDGSRAISGADDNTVKIWDLESDEITSDSPRILKGHKNSVFRVVVTEDGEQIVSCAGGFWDKSIKVWDMESGEVAQTLEGHTKEVRDLVLVPSSSRAVSGSADAKLIVWDLASGELLHTLEGHTDEIWSVVVTQDGTRAISGSADSTIRVWDLTRGEEICTLLGHSKTVFSVAVTPDGKQVISGGHDNTLRVWDLETEEEVLKIQGETKSSWNSFFASTMVTPDGKNVITGSGDGTIGIWEIDSGEKIRSLRGHKETVFALALTPEGDHLISGGHEKTIKVWDLASGEELHSFQGHSNTVWSVAVTPDGTQIVSGSGDETIRVWSLEGILKTDEVLGHTASIRSLAVTPGGDFVISGGWDNIPRVWDQKTGHHVRPLLGYTNTADTVAVTPDGNHAITCGGHDLRVWDLGSGEEMEQLRRRLFRNVNVIAVAPDASRIATVSHDVQERHHLITIIDLENGEVVPLRMGHAEQVSDVAFTPDGKKIISSSWDKTICVWDVESGKKLHTTKGLQGRLSAVAMTPDGEKVIASALNNKTIRVWEMQFWKRLHTFEGHTEMIMDVAVTPDGRHAVSGAADNTIRVWNLESGEMRACFTLGGSINTCTVSADGSTIIAGDEAGLVHFLRLEGLTPCEPILTPLRLSDENSITHCPYCASCFGIDETNPGNMVHCPDCRKTIQLNPFEADGSSAFKPLAVPDNRGIQKPGAAKEFVEEVYSEGFRLYQSRDFTGAIDCFNQVLRLQPDHGDGIILRLGALLELGRDQEALESANEVIENNLVSGRHLAYVYAYSGNAQLKLGHPNEALLSLDHGLEHDQEIASLWLTKGFAHSQKGEYPQALECFTKSNELEQNDVAEVYSAFCMMNLDKVEQAFLTFQNLIESGSEHPLAFYGYGILLITREEPEEACKWIKRFLDKPGPGKDSQDVIPMAKQIVEKLC